MINYEWVLSCFSNFGNQHFTHIFLQNILIKKSVIFAHIQRESSANLLVTAKYEGTKSL